jgi:hypothetical protein
LSGGFVPDLVVGAADGAQQEVGCLSNVLNVGKRSVDILGEALDSLGCSLERAWTPSASVGQTEAGTVIEDFNGINVGDGISVTSTVVRVSCCECVFREMGSVMVKYK